MGSNCWRRAKRSVQWFGCLVRVVSTDYDILSIHISFCGKVAAETNTFHMPYGEITITLDDVCTILRIQVTGKSVSAKSFSTKRAESLVTTVLGVTSDEAHQESSAVRGYSMRLEWLSELFGMVSDIDPEPQIRCAARAYLLYIPGCTHFIDKSGTRVPVIYLSLLLDFHEVRTYAWVLLCWHICIDSWDLLPSLSSSKYLAI